MIRCSNRWAISWALEERVGSVWPVLHYTTGLAMLVLGMGSVYYFAPNVKQNVWRIAPGTLFAVMAFIVAVVSFLPLSSLRTQLLRSLRQPRSRHHPDVMALSDGLHYVSRRRNQCRSSEACWRAGRSKRVSSRLLRRRCSIIYTGRLNDCVFKRATWHPDCGFSE